jgi:DNA topoisomerase IA
MKGIPKITVASPQIERQMEKQKQREDRLQEIAKGLVNWRRVVARMNEEMAQMVWKRNDTGG